MTFQGPPLEIAWDPIGKETWEFDEFENSRAIRRTYVEMNIPMEIRIELLQSLGFSPKDIKLRSNEVKALRIKRLETQQQMYRTKNHEQMEMLTRGLKNFFTNKKKKERDLLASTRHLGVLPKEDDEADL